MYKIPVDVNPQYYVYVERGGLIKIGEYVRSVTKAKSAFVITDVNVNKHYGSMAVDALKASGFDAHIIVLPAGERTKSASNFLRLIEMLASMKVKRTDVIVALGGGVIGDIAGFAAATYMRGIDLVQVPTSLLAMIDSSVGGKTGVDLSAGKNLLGAFYQPKLVIADPDVLETLPEKEWKNGMGEGVKYACLAGREIASMMKRGLDEKNIEKFIMHCVSYKAYVVSCDEKEGGQRKLLNLGHTLGHALEKESDYKISHGLAVAQGVAWMAVAAYNNGELCPEDLALIIAMIEKNKLLSDVELTSQMFEAIRMDKKAEGSNEISAITICGLGNCVIKKMTFDSFEEYVLKGI